MMDAVDPRGGCVFLPAPVASRHPLPWSSPEVDEPVKRGVAYSRVESPLARLLSISPRWMVRSPGVPGPGWAPRWDGWMDGWGR